MVPAHGHGDFAVYDSSIGKVTSFGWKYDVTWTYDPVANAWTEFHPAGDIPPQRQLGSLVYDPGTEKVILFGGSYGTGTDEEYFNDTWAYGVNP